jgi:predicted HD phosphohydrolase
MQITIENKEYEIDETDTDIMPIVNTVALGKNTITMLDHALQCVRAVHVGKVDELTKLVSKKGE